MPQRIAQFTVTVRDYDEALTFYVEKLGFECVEDTDLGHGKRWVVVRPAGGSGAAILLARAASPTQQDSVGKQTGGRVFVFIETDDFRRDYDAMRARGVTFVREPAVEAYGTVAVFEDLYGNQFDLIERNTFRIRRAEHDAATTEALAALLVATVADGASVGFMHPLALDVARPFCDAALASASRGERIVLVAEDIAPHAVVGTVQVVLALPENQPHRAEVAKMQVHPSARRRGLGEALMRAAESAARDAGRTLLVLDTMTGSDAERLYERLGWTRSGTIPCYALWPRGGAPGSTTVFYRQLAPQE